MVDLDEELLWTLAVMGWGRRAHLIDDLGCRGNEVFH